ARSLGYLVVGINEYYSSKRCPVCKNFVAQTTDWRTLYCHTCKRFRQRDVMASDNMNNAIKRHLEDQERPLYLQPKRQDGSYPWTEVVVDCGSGGGAKGRSAGAFIAVNSAVPSMATSSGTTGPEKRASGAQDPPTPKRRFRSSTVASNNPSLDTAAPPPNPRNRPTTRDIKGKHRKSQAPI
ncbi:hypothetical protein BGZ52_005508, partial [Haplosporangium bisporale]